MARVSRLAGVRILDRAEKRDPDEEAEDEARLNAKLPSIMAAMNVAKMTPKGMCDASSEAEVTEVVEDMEGGW